MKVRLWATLALMIIGSLFALNGALAQQGVKRTDLQQHDLSVPGREVVQVRVDIAPGVTAPKHKHPGEEIIYLIEGTLEYEVEVSHLRHSKPAMFCSFHMERSILPGTLAM